MHLALLTLALGAAFTAAAPPANDHVIHEKRDFIPAGWKRSSKLADHQLLPIKIALKQANLDRLEEYLMDVSDPNSSNYGNHWSHKQIAETFAPSTETVKAVQDWLAMSGLGVERVKTSQSLGWLHFNATVTEAEALLGTEYHLYEHESSDVGQVACTEYYLPEHLHPHIDFITPTVHFDAKLLPPVGHSDADPLAKRASTLGASGSGFSPKLVPINPLDIINELEDCSNNITPDCLRALYGIPLAPILTNPANSYGIVEYTPQSYIGSDLDLFFSNYSRNQVQRRPILDSIDGGFLFDTLNIDQNDESNLDLEYAMALVNPIKVTLYQAGDAEQGASFNNFLDALDASYCGSDDPTQDGVYPDFAPGGYEGPETCGGFAATKVVSTSYGYNEADLTPAYELRQCAEYAKLGLAGTTFLYSSGDYGVAGNGGQCIDPITGKYNDGKTGKFNPSFPGTCPYVLSVGATQIRPNASVLAPEEACETIIYSGGGFSNVFAQPQYQKAAVARYYASYNPPYTAAQYNNSRTVRGFPDVAANGAKYVVALDGTYKYHLYGTSASSPTFGAVITLLNEFRLNAGKGSIGFINPALYANPSMLNDITSGGNQGCGTPGFTAVPGWDPVTGLGVYMLLWFALR